LRDLRDTATMVGLTTILLILGLAAAVALPPGFVGGGASAPLTYVPPGHLALSVSMNNGDGVYTPVDGSRVRVSQTLLHGFTLLALTNESGEVEMTLSSGPYAVSVYDGRFSFETGVSLNPGKVTQLQVRVNRTSIFAFWVEAQDSSTTGQVETWNQIEVAVPTSGANYITVPIRQPVNYSNYKFPTNVFLQTVEFQSIVGFLVIRGPEIPAAVISQVISSGNIWLVLKPLAPLSLSGANYLGVVTYEAAGTVTVKGA
jgi:hypothetical protein